MRPSYPWGQYGRHTSQPVQVSFTFTADALLSGLKYFFLFIIVFNFFKQTNDCPRRLHYETQDKISTFLAYDKIWQVTEDKMVY